MKYEQNYQQQFFHQADQTLTFDTFHKFELYPSLGSYS